MTPNQQVNSLAIHYISSIARKNTECSVWLQISTATKDHHVGFSMTAFWTRPTAHMQRALHAVDNEMNHNTCCKVFNFLQRGTSTEYFHVGLPYTHSWASIQTNRILTVAYIRWLPTSATSLFSKISGLITPGCYVTYIILHMRIHPPQKV